MEGERPREPQQEDPEGGLTSPLAQGGLVSPPSIFLFVVFYFQKSAIISRNEVSMSTALQNIRDFLNHKTPHLLSVHHDSGAYRQCPDHRRMVEIACGVIAKDMALPASCNVLPSLFPDFGTVSMPAIYGGVKIPARDGGGIHITPVARTIGDVLKLTQKPFEETDFQRALDMHGEICKRLGTDGIYLRAPDFQGPINTLALLFEDQSELMMAMYDQPELVHEAARRVTDMLIDYTAKFRAAVGAEKHIGNIWPYTALIDGKGVSITQDYMPLLGSELYAEFELPYLKRISDTFGGVFIHCCGYYGWHLPALAASGIEIIGLECSNDHTPFSELHKHFGDRIAILCGGNGGHPTLASYLRSFKGQPCAKARFWLCPCQDNPELDDLRRALDELAN